jgi:hypothetical protein
MNDCYYDKKDWRVCKNEVSIESQCQRIFLSGPSPNLIAPVLGDLQQRADESLPQMEAFRQCWKRKGNEQRTQSKDVSVEK